MGSLLIGSAGILVFLSLGILLLGLAGWLQAWPLFFLIGLAFILWLACVNFCRTNYPEDFRGLEAYPLLRWPLTLLFIFTSGTVLLAPPIFDELTYHLALPFRYLFENRISSIPYQLYSNFPLNVEMLYTAGEMIWGIYLPRFIDLGFAGLTALMLLAIARRHFSYQAGWLANLAFFSLFSVSTLMPFAYNDFGLAFFCLASLFCFLNWSENDQLGWLIGAGCFSGAALGVKYLAGIHFAALLILIIIVDAIKKTDRKQRFSNLFLFSFSSFLLFLPWLIKNWLATGNPAYPFLYSIFGGRGWSALNDHRYFDLMRSLYGPPGEGWRRLLNLPEFLLLNFKGDVPLGPTLLLIISSLFFLRRADRKIKLLAGYSLLFFILWTTGSMVNRFLMPGLAAASLLAGVLIGRSKERWFYNISVAVLIATLFFNIFLVSSLPHSLGTSFAEAQELVAMSTACSLLVKSHEKLLLVGEVRTYGFRCRVIAPTMFDSNYLEPVLAKVKTREEFVAILRKEGVAYLLLNNERLRWLQADFKYFHDTFLLKKFLVYLNASQFRPIFSYGRLVLFRLEPPPRQGQNRQST